MITAYISAEDPDSADIAERLRELVVAHTIVYRDGNPAPPVLADDDTLVRGKRDILAHLDRLELFLGEWSRFQSDACYCDANGNVE